MKKVLTMITVTTLLGGSVLGNSALAFAADNSMEIIKVDVSGGYSEERQVSDNEEAMIRSLMNVYGNDNYDVLSVKTQVVAGTNYEFKCETKDNVVFTVHVYCDLNGNKTITDIIE